MSQQHPSSQTMQFFETSVHRSNQGVGKNYGNQSYQLEEYEEIAFATVSKEDSPSEAHSLRETSEDHLLIDVMYKHYPTVYKTLDETNTLRDKLRRSSHTKKPSQDPPCTPSQIHETMDALTSPAPDPGYAVLENSQELGDRRRDSVVSCDFDEYEELHSITVPKQDPTFGLRAEIVGLDVHSKLSAHETLHPLVTNPSTSDYDSFQRPAVEKHLLYQRISQ